MSDRTIEQSAREVPVSARIRVLVFYLFSFFLLLAVQSVWLPEWSWEGVVPNVGLVFAVLCGTMFGAGDAAAAGLLAGFVLDFSFGRLMGSSMLLLAVLAILANRLSSRRIRGLFFCALLNVTLISLVYEVLIRLITIMVRWQEALPAIPGSSMIWLERQLAPALLLNLFCAVPLFVMLYYIGPYRRKRDEEIQEARKRPW